jgi:hypothetical protein
MVPQAAAQIDRTAPGHYQGRLSALLSRHPVSLPQAPRLEQYTTVRRVHRPQPRRPRSGQLALPLELS